jgi:methionyl aminopeptidase
MIVLKSPDEIRIMHRAGKIASNTLKEIKKIIKPGIKTKYLSEIAEKLIKKSGGRAAFKGYRDFPEAICVSINEEVVHGIPGERRLKPEDIVSIDLGVEYNGYYGDIAATFPVGNLSPEAKRLINVTKSALEAGIENCKIGKKLYDISHSIQKVAEENGYSVVRQYVGHGIGKSLHEDPQVPNCGKANRGPVLAEGMVFALEPMVNEKNYKVETLSDNWTVITCDRGLSAHFEHTVAVTKSGPLVLTR